MTDEDNLGGEEVDFLLRVLVQNSLPFVNGELFETETSYQVAMVQFCCGAGRALAFGTSVDYLACVQSVLKDIFENFDCDENFVADVIRSAGDEKTKFRLEGEIAVSEIRRALNRLSDCYEQNI